MMYIVDDSYAIEEQRRSIESARSQLKSTLPLKPEINEEIELFVDRHFKGKHVLGVHYRGTDKEREAPRVPYETVVDAVRRYLAAYPEAVVFAASDESNFLDFLSVTLLSEYGKDLITANATILAPFMGDFGVPAWHSDFSGGGSGYQRGREALRDCLLLSRVSFLIRTSSLLSAYAQILNPSLRVHILNKQKNPWFPEADLTFETLPDFVSDD